jgi:Na+/melibiose symporter-like transporter
MNTRTRLAYGVGGMVHAVKDAAFIHFVPFFYAQVAGLSPELYGLSALIGQLSDAVTDPLVGTLSDATRSRWGRRHPWMLASGLPLGVCVWLLFHPPAAAGRWVLWAWITGISVLLRTALTAFNIPLHALGAELSTDYVERTRIVSYRTTAAWLAGVLLPSLAYAVVFQAVDGRDGRLIASNYTVYAAWSVVASVVCVLVATWGTRGVIGQLVMPRKTRVLRPLDPFRDVRDALANRNFRLIFVAQLLIGVTTGVSTLLATFAWAYFWEFSPATVGLITLSSLVPTALAFVLIGPLSRRFEKRGLVVFSIALIAANALWWYGGRLIDVLPANGTPALLALAYLHQLIIVFGAVLQQSILPSMIADVADEHEVKTGERQDGVFQAATGFALKVPLGLGQAVGGLLLAWVGLRSGAEPGSVSEQSLFRLGLAIGPFVAVLYGVALFALLRYDLTRARQLELRTTLAAR